MEVWGGAWNCEKRVPEALIVTDTDEPLPEMEIPLDPPFAHPINRYPMHGFAVAVYVPAGRVTF